MNELEKRLKKEQDAAELLKILNAKTEADNQLNKMEFEKEAPLHWENVIIPTMKELVDTFKKYGVDADYGNLVTNLNQSTRTTSISIKKNRMVLQASICQESTSFELCFFYSDKGPSPKNLIHLNKQRGYTIEQLTKELIVNEVDEASKKLQ